MSSIAINTQIPALQARGVTVKFDEPQLPQGDVSGNIAVTAYDAALVLQHISGIITLSEEQQDRGDVDGEVGISASDAELILKKVVGLIDEF